MKHILKKGKISKLLPEDIEGGGGLSNETHLIQYNGKRYVLRKCKSKKDADNYEKISQKLFSKNILPRLLYRQDKDLIYEFIPGRDLRLKDALKASFQIGEITAKIHNIKLKTKENYNIKNIFEESIKNINKKRILTSKESKELQKLFEYLYKKVKPKVGLDLTDIVPANFRINKGKIYAVDIEAIKTSFIGRGIAKAFLKWFTTSKQKENFLKGYSKHRSAKFLDENYLKLSELFFIIHNTNIKIKEKREYSKNIKRIKKILNKNTCFLFDKTNIL